MMKNFFLSTENIIINNVSSLVRTHISGVSGIIVGKQKNNNLIEGIVPNCSLINAINIIDLFILTNTQLYAKKNSDPESAYYYKSLVRKNLVSDAQISKGVLKPDNNYSKKSAAIINFSITWNINHIGQD